VFQEQVERVCETYRKATSRYSEHGTRTVCIDEMTGIQALQRTAPDKPMQPGSAAKHEFEYIRHGTTTLIGNFDVVSGEMFCCTINPTRTEEDFVVHIQQTVESDPQAGWVFVVDNLNTHCSASLVEYIAKQCDPEVALGMKGEAGVLKSMASRRAFLEAKEHRIRFVFLPKHSSWLNQIEIVFGIVMRKLIRRGNFTSRADLESKLRQFLEYFNRVFAHPFLWTYTGKPTATPSLRLKFIPPHHITHRLAA
jgi:DDE superfamily endonuclease